jgi:hypothetical protein
MEDKMALHLHPSDGKRDKELTQPIPVGLITISLAKNFYIDLNFIISHPQVRIEIQTHTEKYPEHARTKKKWFNTHVRWVQRLLAATIASAYWIPSNGISFF